MRKFVVTGLAPLMNMCCSGLITHSDKIVYLDVINLDKNKPKLHTQLQTTREFAREISAFFNFTIEFGEQVIWACAPHEKRQKNPIEIIQNGDISICNNDVISANLIQFFSQPVRGKIISVFPEGASCYASLTKTKHDYNHTIRTLFRTLRRICHFGFTIKIMWVLPDCENRVEKFMNTKKCPKFMRLIDKDSFFLRRKNLASHFSKKYPDFNFSDKGPMCVHTPVYSLDETKSNDWLKKCCKALENCQILVKPHPSDDRDYSKIFSEFNCCLIPRKYSCLPGELIIDQLKDYHFAGYYSTLLTSIPREKITIIEPNDSKVAKNYAAIYEPMVSILDFEN